VDSRAPAVAAGLIITAELAFRAVEREEGRAEPRLIVRTALAIGAAAVCAALIGGILLDAGGSVNSGLGLEAGGVAAAVVTVAFVVRLGARR
jgi:hypothetical protein